MTDEQPPERIELEHLKRVRLDPGEVLVLQCPEGMSQKDAAEATRRLCEMFPANACIALSDKIQLGVVRPILDAEA